MGLINGYSDGQETVDKTLETKINPYQPFIADVDEHWITFGDIRCYDQNNAIFESYKRVQLARKPLGNSRTIKFNFGDAHTSIPEGQFLPSAALVSQCLMLLFREGQYDIIHDYNGRGNTFGGHQHSTLIDWAEGQIIHYPQHPLTHYEQPRVITRLPFNYGRSDSRIFKKCNPELEAFLKNITGLQNPGDYFEIGEMFGHCAIAWVPNINELPHLMTAVHIGSDHGDFSINARTYLSDRGFVRPARVP